MESKNQSGSSRTPIRRKWIRLAVVALAAVVVAIVILVALLPTILSGSIGRSLVVGIVKPMVQGEVSIAELSLSWSGPQVIRGFAVAGNDGASITVDVRADNGLLGLARGSEPPRLSLSGSIATNYRPDGTLSLATLFRTPESERSASVPPEPRGESASLAETLRGVVVEITSLRFVATSTQGDPRIEISNFQGKFAVENSGIRANFSAQTKVGEKSGDLKLDGVVDGLFTKDGGVDVTSASVALDLHASALAIPAVGIPIAVESLDLKVSSSRVADALRVVGECVFALPTGETAKLSATLDATSPLDAANRAVSGSVAVVNLPTSAIAPYLPAPLNAQRDLGATLNASITLDGRNGSGSLSTQKISCSFAGALSPSGELLAVDRLSIAAQVDPALVASAVRVAEPVAITLEGTDIAVPLRTGGTADAPWKDARANVIVSIAPMSVAVSPEIPLALGATTIRLQTTDLMTAVTLQVRSTVDGSALEIDQTIGGLIGSDGIALDSARAKGSLKVAAVSLANPTWFDDATRSQLAACAVTSLSLQVANDGTLHAGKASVDLTIGATSVDTEVSWTQSGFSTNPIECDLIVLPSMLAHFAGASVAIESSARLKLQVDGMAGTWEAISAGQILPPSIRAKVTADVIDIARAPGLVRGGRLQGVAASATISTKPDGSLGAVDAQVHTKVQALAQSGKFETSIDAASVDATIKLPDLAGSTFQSTAQVTIASGGALATMLDLGDAGAALVGPGSISGSFERSGAADAFRAEIKLPRLTLKTSGSFEPASGHVDVSKTTGSFNIPAEIVEQALGLRAGVDWRSLMVRAGGRNVAGSIDLERFKWTGSPDDASVVFALNVEPASIEASDRAPVSFGKVVIDMASPRLAERAKASIIGSFAVGSDVAKPLAITLDASGDLRALLGSADHPLSLNASSLSVKVPGGLAIALSDWLTQSKSMSEKLARLGDIDAICKINALTLPSTAATKGTADLRLELGAISLEPTGKKKLSFGKSVCTVKSKGFDQDLIVAFDGMVQVADSPPSAVSAAVALDGDLRPLFGTATIPLALQASEVQVKFPGALALALADWSSGNKNASAAMTSLGSIDAGLHVKSLTIPPTGILDAAFDLSLDLGAIEFEPAGKPPIGLKATRVVAQSPRLRDALSISVQGAGANAGEFSAQANGRGLTSAAGEFDALAGAWTAKVTAKKIATALIDAIAGQGGQLVEAIGPELDATVDAQVASDPTGKQSTIVNASLKTQYLSITAPSVAIGGGVATIAPTNPLAITFTINKVLQRRLLEPLNPVLADIRSAPPIRLHVTRASYPLDGNLCALDLDARVDVGDVEVVRSNQVLGVLALAQSAKSDTIPARIEPLVISVKQGDLRYSDFIVKAGKFGDQWQQQLNLSGDIDLCKIPPYANAITCRYPLSSLGRTIGGATTGLSSTMQQLSEAIAKLPVDPGDLVQVDITLSGPLGEVDGKKVPLGSKVKLVFDASSLDGEKIQKGIKNIGGAIKDIGKLFGK